MSISSLKAEKRKLNTKILNIKRIRTVLQNIESDEIKNSIENLKDSNNSFAIGGLVLNNNKSAFDNELGFLIDDAENLKATAKNLINSIPAQIRKYEQRISAIESEIRRLENSK